MKILPALIGLAVLLIVTGSCTITHKYGPFMGKVVDAESGAPVEGAAVLIVFSTKSSSVGGWVGKFADAIEGLTNNKGEFYFASKRINLFRGNAVWDNRCRITIFKPGYGTYPGHPNAFSSWQKKQSFFIPEDEYVTYYLPKLVTVEERKKNLHNIVEPSTITIEKMPNFQRLKKEEYISLGID